MSINAVSGFSQLESIRQTVGQIGQAGEQSHQATLKQLDVSANRSDQASKEVVQQAIRDEQQLATNKGRMIDVMA